MNALTLLLLAVPAAAPPTAHLPTPADVRRAAERSLPWLLKSSEDWRTDRKCVTCHQVPFALWPLNDARARGLAVDGKRLDALTAWSLDFCRTNKNKDGSLNGGFLSTMVKTTLALEAAPRTKEANAALLFFEPLIARYQRPDGSWKEGNFIGVKGAEREGIEVDTMWTVLALDAVEARGALDAKALASARKNRDRALAFLKDAKPATRSDWLALKMLVGRRHATRDKADACQKALRERQNADGGWPFVKGGDSHPLVTGEVLYALSVAGVPGDDAAVRRACAFLIRTQRPNGTWESTSRAELGKSGARKVNAINIHWGTGWATIGLLRSLPLPAR